MLAKAWIKRSFANASSTYDSVSDLQRQSGRELLARLEVLPRDAIVIDLGCGTGFLSAELYRNNLISSGHVIAVDIALPMLHLARNKLPGKEMHFICADAERLPFADQSVDLIVSNLALQWCQRPGEALQSIKRILQPTGQLLLTTFGPQTLRELKAAWQQVDNHAHVNDFTSIEELAVYVKDAGFDDATLDNTLHVSIYPTVMALMIELKQLGAQTVIKGRNRPLTNQGKLNRMINVYQQSAEDGLIPATFEIITLIARA